jgi:hypothetical protein
MSLQSEVWAHVLGMVRDVSMVVSDGRSATTKDDPNAWGLVITGGTPEEQERLLECARSFASGWNARPP